MPTSISSTLEIKPGNSKFQGDIRKGRILEALLVKMKTFYLCVRACVRAHPQESLFVSFFEPEKYQEVKAPRVYSL